MEVLEDRTLLSDSPLNPQQMIFTASPQAAAIVANVSTMIAQRAELIATIVQYVNNAWNTLGQEIAQTIYSIEQPWGIFFGINPNTQNQSLTTTAMPTGSGSGSGAGSGSSATASPVGQTPAIGGIKAQPLDGNGAPGDRYEWDPGVGYNVIYGVGGGGGSGSATHIVTPNDGLASNPGNWYKNEQIQTVQIGGSGPFVPGNQAGDTVWLGWSGAGSAGLQPIEWNGNFTFSTLNFTGYGAQETIDSGDTLELTGANNSGTSLNMDDSSELKGELAPNSTYKIDKSGTITNMDLGGDPSTELWIAGGITTIASGNYTEKLGTYLLISPDATLNHKGQCTLTLTNDGSKISVKGTMNVTHGPTATQTLIDRGETTLPYISVSGTLTYSGTRGVTDTLNVPIEVADGGKFSVSGDPTQLGNSRLIVNGSAGDLTHNACVYLTDPGSTIQLSNEAILECDSGYFQDGGMFETYDTTICTLQMGAAGTARALMNGGGLMMNGSAQQGFGELDVNGNLNFFGTYYPWIDGNASNRSDLLKVNGAMLIQDATLSITTLGAVVANNGWTIITANNTLQPFSTTNENQLGLQEIVSPNYELVS